MLAIEASVSLIIKVLVLSSTETVPRADSKLSSESTEFELEP